MTKSPLLTPLVFTQNKSATHPRIGLGLDSLLTPSKTASSLGFFSGYTGLNTGDARVQAKTYWAPFSKITQIYSETSIKRTPSGPSQVSGRLKEGVRLIDNIQRSTSNIQRSLCTVRKMHVVKDAIKGSSSLPLICYPFLTVEGISQIHLILVFASA